ncbi:hypothetical protein COR50_20710 [Chitinophaga caeni]|uniref:Translation elongation factor EFTu/EF1A C-terminal domain-containing protein n=1 Tax=Chitinophaga caeni TaxID=2029983 RepID=A0A291QZY4_9BACT|nr:hypothetical protein [Chitinophaga caeni]ATL49404.1 hypothetical protein COR50_20710 [Chitinophaga caeni]
MRGNIKWESKGVIIGRRAFLFCFGDKCMSGKILDFHQMPEPDKFEIAVSFIEPEFFRAELVVGNKFTIREGYKVLAEGVVL